MDSVCSRAAEDYPNAEISFDKPDELLAVTDEGVEYALEETIENAIEHNDRPEPTVDITVKAGENDEAVIRIADNGPRIPAVERDVLDEMVETSSTYHGTGVGLWVMQWCLNSHGGTLSFEANDPRGNIVVMTLPRRETESTDSEATTGSHSTAIE